MQNTGTARAGLISILLVLAVALGGCPMFPEPPEPTLADEPGPFAVGTFDTSFSNGNGVYFSTVYHPLSDDEAPYPVVTVSPGTCSAKEFHLWIGNHLASHGYVVLIFTAPNPCFGGPFPIGEGLADGIVHLETLGNDATSPVFGIVDASTRAIIGHSLGAIGSLILASAESDQLDAVIPLAPGALDEGSMSLITAPIQVHGGSEDCIVPPERATATYDLSVNAPRQLLVIEGANHVIFNDEGSLADIGGPLVGDCERTIASTDHGQRLSRRYFTAWLEFHLKGNDAFRTFIDGEQADRDVADGWFTDFRVEID